MKKILAILLSLLTLLSCGFLSACSAEKAQPDTPDTETVWEMVSEAYIYAFPLVLTDATKTLSTNTDGTMTGRAPINQFNHAKKLADASFRTVVTPNVDTVYSQAWLDISTEPMVYVLPETDRLLSCVGCAQDGRKEPGAEKADLGLTADVKPATDFTAKANAAIYDELDFDDKQEYEFATRGLIDAPETLELKDEDGKILWSQEAYAFLDDYEKAPDSVNPSLWENTKNNHAYGLFEVTDGIYQVRGYDMANLTVVKGDTGWIVFDTLMSVECSQAAMQLIEKNLGKFPVKAVIISHSHVDHFGGNFGIHLPAH